MGTVVVWRDGKKRTVRIDQRSTGTSDRHEAEAIRTQVEASFQRGNIENRDAPSTFSQLVASYLDAGKSDRYLAPIVRAMGDLEVHELTQITIDREGKRAYPDVQPATLRRQWHGVINAVVRHHDKNFKLTLPAKSRSTTNFCTPEQAEAIISACRNSRFPTPWKAALPELLFGTGCRVDEAMRLDGKHDVNLDYGTVTFRDTKNGWDRTVTLLPRTIAALRDLPNVRSSGPLIRKAKDEPYAERKQIGGHQLIFLRAAAERAEVDFNPHMTRHTFATWFYCQTKDVLRLQHQGGWRTLSMVQRYTHLAPTKVGLDAAAAGWDFREKIGLQLELPKNAVTTG
jgi:integrase